MFGRKKPKRPPGGDAKNLDEPVAIALELGITRVVESVDAYLATPSERGRAELLRVLGLLDDETAAADAYTGLWTPAARYGGPGISHALGATSAYSAVGEEPVKVFDAQVVLVRAAKQQVLNPSAANLEALRSAAEVLHGMGDQAEG
jgi:hypothetical protein